MIFTDGDSLSMFVFSRSTFVTNFIKMSRSTMSSVSGKLYIMTYHLRKTFTVSFLLFVDVCCGAPQFHVVRVSTNSVILSCPFLLKLAC